MRSSAALVGVFAAFVSWQAGCGQGGQPPTVLQQGELAPPPIFAPGSYCDPGPFGRWCYYNTRPSGDRWMAVGGRGPNQLWVSGSSTGALHFDGLGWTRVDTGLTTVEGFAVFSPTNAWAVGQIDDGTGIIAHFDGTGFTTIFHRHGEFQDVWGSGPNDIYAVGWAGAVHWDGAQWSAVAGIDGMSVSGTAPNDVWVANGPEFQHFNGVTWTQVPQLVGFYVDHVIAVRRHDVWVTATNSGVTNLVHYDGNAWTPSYTLLPTENVRSLGAGDGKDVWAVGTDYVAPNIVGLLLHFDGAIWQHITDPPAPLWRAVGIGQTDYAVGEGGQILRLHPTASTPWTDLSQGPLVPLQGTWGSSPTDMWAVGEGGVVLHYDGGTVKWRKVAPGITLNAVWGLGSQSVWAVGLGGTALHYNGSTFHPFNVGTAVDLFAVFTGYKDDVWIGGDANTLLHVQGTTVTPVTLVGLPPSSKILVIHGIGRDDIWLGGESSQGGFVSHYDGVNWSPPEFITATAGFHPISRLWEAAPDDVWTITTLGVGSSWQYFHFDGIDWTELFTAPTPDSWMFNGAEGNVATSSFALGSDDVWSVGVYGAWRRRIP